MDVFASVDVSMRYVFFNLTLTCLFAPSLVLFPWQLRGGAVR